MAELRPVYVPPDPASRTTYLAGEIAQCDFWFPIRLPVGFGQTRTAAQLPVLTMTSAMPGGPRRCCCGRGGGGGFVCRLVAVSAYILICRSAYGLT